MDAADSITRLNGVSAYTAQLSLGKVASSGNDTSSDDTSGRQNSSTSSELALSNQESTQKSFGFKLGKLGIRYVSEESDVDYDLVAEEALKHAERTQSAAYKSEMEIAMLMGELHTESTQGQADATAEVSALQAHYGNMAYSRMSQTETTDSDQSVLLGIV